MLEDPGRVSVDDSPIHFRGEGYVELLTTLFVPKKEGVGYHPIQFYCRCGDELHGLRHFDVYPPYIALECYSCGYLYDWHDRGQREAVYELTAAWDEIRR